MGTLKNKGELLEAAQEFIEPGAATWDPVPLVRLTSAETDALLAYQQTPEFPERAGTGQQISAILRGSPSARASPSMKSPTRTSPRSARGRAAPGDKSARSTG